MLSRTKHFFSQFASFRLPKSPFRERSTRQSLDELENAWERFKASHEDQVNPALSPNAASGIFIQTPQPWLDTIMRDINIELGPSSQILDIGTGNGICALAFHILSGAKVHSVERDGERLRVAEDFRKFLAQEEGKEFPQVTFERRDILEHSLRPYNLVYFFATLPVQQHDLCEKILKKCSEELQQGAYFVCPNFRFRDENAGDLLPSDMRRKMVADLDFREISLGATWHGDGGSYKVLIVRK